MSVFFGFSTKWTLSWVPRYPVITYLIYFYRTEIQKRFYPSYHQRLMRQSHGELESIKYLDSKNASPTVKKTEVNFLAFSPTQWGPNKSVRLCLAVMAVLMVCESNLKKYMYMVGNSL